MAERSVNDYTCVADIDHEILKLEGELQEIEFLHQNLQLIRRYLGNALQHAQSKNNSGQSGCSNNITQITSSGQPSTSCGSGSTAGKTVCSDYSCQQTSSGPSSGCSADTPSSAPTGSTLADIDFCIRRCAEGGGPGGTTTTPQINMIPPSGVPYSSAQTGSRSTLAEFRIKPIPSNERGQIVVGQPFGHQTYGTLTSSSKPSPSNTNTSVSTGQASQHRQLNYFQQQYPYLHPQKIQHDFQNRTI